MQTRRLFPFSILVLGFSMPAAAQFRCNCATIVDSCTADVVVDGSTVDITTEQSQCARVDYLIDGQPFVTVVMDGRNSQNISPLAQTPSVLVQSCQVCQDTTQAAATASRPAPGPRAAATTGPETSATAATARDTDERPAGLRPLIEVPPTYPASAAARGTQGHVDVHVTIGPEGSVREAAVKAAEPADVFDAAALSAVRRWRYPAEPGRESRQTTERVEFRLANAAPAARTAEPAPRPEELTNGCIREGSVFNYGELIEVGLLNACSIPAMVYVCGGGNARYSGFWTCTSSEQQQTLLIKDGDQRIGQTTTLENDTTLIPVTYTDRLFLSRAPNAEYWWLACAIDDVDCRSAGRQWVRSMDRQLASVDPEGRSGLPIARSY